jgi:hypothetical protein
MIHHWRFRCLVHGSMFDDEGCENCRNAGVLAFTFEDAEPGEGPRWARMDQRLARYFEATSGER